MSHFQRGQALISAGRREDAAKAFLDHLSEYPQDAMGYAMLSFCTDDLKQKVDYAQKAISLDPEEDWAHYAFGIAHWARGNHKLAERGLRQALYLNPERASYHEYYARFLGSRGRWKEAEEEIKFALELDPEDADAQAFQAKVLSMRGKKADARLSAERAIQLDPESSEAHLARADFQLQHGDRQQAISHYYEALRQDPNDEEAREGLLNAMRAKYRIYRWILVYSNWVESLPVNVRSFVGIGFYLLIRVLSSVSRKASLPIKIVGGILVGLYLTFFLTLWMAPSILDGFISLTKEGKLILDRFERFTAKVVLGFAGVGLFCGLVAAFSRDPWLAMALVCGLGCFLLAMIRQGTTTPWLKKSLFYGVAGFMALLFAIMTFAFGAKSS